MLVLTLSLARCFSWCLRPQMPVIMANLDHRTVWRFTGAVLGQGFSPFPWLCYVCLGPDSVLHSGVSAVAVLRGLRCCFHAVFPFHCRQARVAKRHALLGPFPGSEVLGQVVLARRCATPGAVSVRAVRSVARGDTTGAVLGRGLGHYDRCRGLDSLDRRLLIVALRQFPIVLVRFPSCFSLAVDVPVVVMQQVVCCPW